MSFSLYCWDIVDIFRMDWMVLNGDKLVVGTEEVGEDEEDEVEEEEVKSKLDMRGEGIWRNDQRELHRRDSWMDGHVLSRYMVRRKEEKRGKLKKNLL
jgi:hypothetical protein